MLRLEQKLMLPGIDYSTVDAHRWTLVVVCMTAYTTSRIPTRFRNLLTIHLSSAYAAWSSTPHRHFDDVPIWTFQSCIASCSHRAELKKCGI